MGENAPIVLAVVFKTCLPDDDDTIVTLIWGNVWKCYRENAVN